MKSLITRHKTAYHFSRKENSQLMTLRNVYLLHVLFFAGGSRQHRCCYGDRLLVLRWRDHWPTIASWLQPHP